MFTNTVRNISVLICTIIFFTKMMISVTPIFSNSLDQDTILQVVLQLEIENTNNTAQTQGEEVQDPLTKYFNNHTFSFAFTGISDAIEKPSHYLHDVDLIIAFHPSVPTPPPNS